MERSIGFMCFADLTRTHVKPSLYPTSRTYVSFGGEAGGPIVMPTVGTLIADRQMMCPKAVRQRLAVVQVFRTFEVMGIQVVVIGSIRTLWRLRK
jgi:hypothetical protein